jgi:hypothetical protein
MDNKHNELDLPTLILYLIVGGMLLYGVVFIVKASANSGSFVPLCIVLGVPALALLVLWFAMLIDCLNGNRSDKVVWVIVLIFLTALGGLLYYFIVYKQESKRNNEVEKNPPDGV